MVSSARQPTGVALDGSDVCWAELRPDQGGRTQLVRLAGAGTRTELLPPDANARTAVHEYGGGSWWVRQGVVWYVDWADQRLRRRETDGTTTAVSPDPGQDDVRWADGSVHPVDGRVAVVRETHPAGTTSAEAVRNEVVVLDGDGSETVVAGPDFVAAPRWSHDGSALCWLEWDHPNMPWDGCRLKVRWADGTVVEVAGGEEEGIAQPRWTADGALWFCSDRADWWTLYRWTPGAGVERMLTEPGDVGRPQWTFGISTYGFLDSGEVVCARTLDGNDAVLVLGTDGSTRLLETGLTSVSALVAAGSEVVLIGGSPTSRPAVHRLDLATGRLAVVGDVADPGVSPDYYSRPRHLQFPGGDGRPSYLHYYPPTNPGAEPEDGELPPLVVTLHGGPTSSASTALSLGVQFWTSRGFAVADVDYGGSTGYGRSYRNRLRGEWGVLDVADCIAAARSLGEQGLADPGRCVIRGGSAGGFTVLMAMATSEVFAAGADLFGVADLEALAQDTHKFESRYLDRLVAPYPEGREVYVDRSPLTHVEGLTNPLIVLQGSQDKVVPPAQSEAIVAALREKGVPVAYRLYEGEQHGFRRAENIADALEAELSFYAQVLGFPQPGGVQRVQIENLAAG